MCHTYVTLCHIFVTSMPIVCHMSGIYITIVSHICQFESYICHICGKFMSIWVIPMSPHCLSRINKIWGLYCKKVEKKIDFVIFDPKKSWSRLGLGWISEKPEKIVKKWLNYLLLGMFIDKVKNFCDHSMILWEMAGDLLTDVLPQPPRVCLYKI